MNDQMKIWMTTCSTYWRMPAHRDERARRRRHDQQDDGRGRGALIVIAPGQDAAGADEHHHDEEREGDDVAHLGRPGTPPIEMISLMMNDAMNAPTMFPSPPSTQIMNVIGPNAAPKCGCTEYWMMSSARRHAGQRAAHGGRHDVDALRVGAHQRHRAAVLRDRADGGADVGARQEEVEPDHRQDGEAERDEPRERTGTCRPTSRVGSVEPYRAVVGRPQERGEATG